MIIDHVNRKLERKKLAACATKPLYTIAPLSKLNSRRPFRAHEVFSIKKLFHDNDTLGFF